MVVQHKLTVLSKTQLVVVELVASDQIHQVAQEVQEVPYQQHLEHHLNLFILLMFLVMDQQHQDFLLVVVVEVKIVEKALLQVQVAQVVVEEEVVQEQDLQEIVEQSTQAVAEGAHLVVMELAVKVDQELF